MNATTNMTDYGERVRAIKPRQLTPPRLWSASKRAGWAMLGAGLFVALWQGASVVSGTVRIATPLTTLTKAISQWHAIGGSVQAGLGGRVPSIPTLLAYTGRNVAIGFVIGAVCGVTLGVLAARIKWISALFAPVVLATAVMPKVVVAPILLILFGITPVASTLLVAAGIAVMVTFASRNAVLATPSIYEEFAVTLGSGKIRRLLGVVLPAALPNIFGTLRAAVATAWGLEVFVELLGAPTGFGQVMNVEANLVRTSDLMALTLWVSVFAVISDLVIVLIGRIIFRWQRNGTR